jgi:hypothetical protein
MSLLNCCFPITHNATLDVLRQTFEEEGRFRIPSEAYGRAAAPSTTVSSAVSTFEDAKSKVTDSESEYFFSYGV